ncbi:hypothetical protein AVEN_1167-1 [Araneus ventricosus]|uniref:Uncharacterized protein n=1 Tax=Araneus ventricosus TaxID=182803 RepID=A0A4Y2EBP7_ARAVE|nr:hypothetical protein AVEN_1167-1 [Araneus ventricosus]
MSFKHAKINPFFVELSWPLFPAALQIATSFKGVEKVNFMHTGSGRDRNKEETRAARERESRSAKYGTGSLSFSSPGSAGGDGEREGREATSNARRSVRQQIKFGHPERA